MAPVADTRNPTARRVMDPRDCVARRAGVWHTWTRNLGGMTSPGPLPGKTGFAMSGVTDSRLKSATHWRRNIAGALVVAALLIPDWARPRPAAPSAQGPTARPVDRETQIIVLPVRPLINDPTGRRLAQGLPPPGSGMDPQSLVMALNRLERKLEPLATGVAELPEWGSVARLDMTLSGSDTPLFVPGSGADSLGPQWSWLNRLEPRHAFVELDGGRLRIVPRGPPSGVMPEALPVSLVKLCLGRSGARLDLDSASLRIQTDLGDAVVPLENGTLGVRPLTRSVQLDTLEVRGLDDELRSLPRDVLRPGSRTLLLLGPPPDLSRRTQPQPLEAVASAIEQILEAPLVLRSTGPVQPPAGSRYLILVAYLLGWLAGWRFTLREGVLISIGGSGALGLNGPLMGVVPLVIASQAGLLVALGGRAKDSSRAISSDTHAPSGLPAHLSDRFRDLAIVGEGGMGVVYSATSRTSGQRVVIKTLRIDQQSNRDVLLRFLAEMKALVHLDHPSVVRVLEVVKTGVPYFVMEEFPSQDLQTLLDRAGRLGENQALRIGAGVAAGLSATHRAEILHRDVKPGNILVGSGGAVKIIDFGLAWMSWQTSITREGIVVGTPRYMAPEQLEGSACTPQTDIYALGLVLYEALTGQHPYPDNVYSKMAYARVPSPADLVTGVSDDTSELVMRCLTRPEKRWVSAEELGGAMRELLGPDRSGDAI